MNADHAAIAPSARDACVTAPAARGWPAARRRSARAMRAATAPPRHRSEAAARGSGGSRLRPSRVGLVAEEVGMVEPAHELDLVRHLVEPPTFHDAQMAYQLLLAVRVGRARAVEPTAQRHAQAECQQAAQRP